MKRPTDALIRGNEKWGWEEEVEGEVYYGDREEGGEKRNCVISARSSRPGKRISKVVFQFMNTTIKILSALQLIYMLVYIPSVDADTQIEDEGRHLGEYAAYSLNISWVKLGSVTRRRKFRFAFELSAIKPRARSNELAKLVVTSELFNSEDCEMNAALKAFIEGLVSREGSSDYVEFFNESVREHSVSSLTVIFVPDPVDGGCWGNGMKSSFPARLAQKFLSDPQSDSNNCLIACFLKKCQEKVVKALAVELTGVPSIDMGIVRAAMFGRNNSKLNYNDAVNMAAKCDIKISISTINKASGKPWTEEIDNQFDPSADLNLILCKDHWAIVVNCAIFKYKKCGKCYNWIVDEAHFGQCAKCGECGKYYSKSSAHTCRSNKQYKNFQEKRKECKLIKPKKSAKNENGGDYTAENDHTYFADFETFTRDGSGEQEVYSAAVVEISTIKEIVDQRNYDMLEREYLDKVECEQFYGSGCIGKFMDHAMTLNGTIIFFNGSAFDLFFVLQWVVDTKAPVTRFLKDRHNRIVCLEIHKKLRFWDLRLLTEGSLASVCVEFGVPEAFRKKDMFNVNSVKSLADAKANGVPEACQYYNKYDVIALGIAYINFVRAVNAHYNFSVDKAYTISSLAYEIWSRDLTKEVRQVLILPTLEEYTYIRRSLYGGRCCPQISKFVSRDCGKPFEEISDYLVYLDAVSLYPASSVRATFPAGKSSWATASNEKAILLSHLKDVLTSGDLSDGKDKELLLRSFVECDVECPRNLLTPFLLSRGPRGELQQSLLPKTRQVYDGYTLMEALTLGYKVVAVHSALVFPRLVNPLKTYMEKVFHNKDASARGSIEYNIHKKLMNGLTGKFNEIFLNEEFSVNHDDEFLGKISIDDLVKLEWVASSNGKMESYLAQTTDNKATPKKNAAIGANILAYSRVIMSEATRFFGGYDNVSNMSYYGDTDSLIISSECYKTALSKPKSSDIFGSKLGLLKDELDGGKIVCAYFLAPKTYFIEYVSRKDGVLWWKMAAKGIPQKLHDISAHDYYSKYNKQVEYDAESSDVKAVNYTLMELMGVEGDDGEVSFEYQPTASRAYLNKEYFQKMHDEDAYVVVHYGSFKRTWCNKDPALKTPGIITTIQTQLDLKRYCQYNYHFHFS
jgi:hypothetical protein